MTTTAPPVPPAPAPPPLNGQDINLAARATRVLLVDRLQPLGLEFEQWLVLNLVGTGLVATREALHDRLSQGLGLGATEVDTVVAGLDERGLLDAEPLTLTADGRARWQQGQAIAAELTSSLYADLDPAELAATRRVLIEVTERAKRQLSSAG